MVSVPIPIDRLPDVVLGRDPGFSRPVAFAALAASDLPDREELLGAVLEETAEPPEIRTAAAVALGRVATAESERVLLANLDEQTPRVLAEIARSLGCIGSEGALARVDELIRSADPRVAEAARFGAALIAHRLGLPGHELAMPAQSKPLTPPVSSPTTPIEFRPEGAERRRAILEDLRRYPLRVSSTTRTRSPGSSAPGPSTPWSSTARSAAPPSASSSARRSRASSPRARRRPTSTASGRSC